MAVSGEILAAIASQNTLESVQDDTQEIINTLGTPGGGYW